MAKLERSYATGGKTISLVATRDGDRLTIARDGATHDFTVVGAGGSAFVLRDGDRLIKGYAVAAGDAVWVHLDGRVIVLRPESSSAHRGHGAAASDGAVTSPMTGTIRKVFAAAGDTVEAGTPLLVVEAMKMEYTLTAPVAGRVRDFAATVGAPVELGAIVARVEAAGG